jgi:hypothetical protein
MSFDELPSEYDDEPIHIDRARASKCKRTVRIVKPDGGIISSHTAIFTSPFVDLLARVINAQDAEGLALTSLVRLERRQKRATFPIASSNKTVVKARWSGFCGRALIYPQALFES